MGRGKSASATKEFIDSEIEMLTDTLEKSLEEGFSPELKPFKDVILSKPEVNNIGKAFAKTHKELMSWIEQNSTYNLSHDELDAVLILKNVLDRRGLSDSELSKNLESLITSPVLTSDNLENVIDENLQGRYKLAINELGSRLAPDIRNLYAVYSSRTTNRLKKARYSMLEAIGEQALVNKELKLTAYRNLDNVINTVENSIKNLNFILAQEEPLFSLSIADDQLTEG